MSRANLSGVNLLGADLSGADLSGVNLSGVNLTGANNTELAIARTRVVPLEGVVTGWKKCRNDVIVKLQVPAKARRSNAFGRKCRAEYVKVLKVIGADVGVSHYALVVKYEKGQTVKCCEWNEDFTIECGGGIHFYMTKEEAEAHV